jgi:CopG family nickel-responsive transcriptional regulator
MKNNINNVTRISVSLSPDLLTNFDKVIKKLGFGDRSKAIQIAIRTFISENEWLSENESVKGVGSIELLYDPQNKNLDNILTLVQHNYNHIVISTIHVHLNDNNCLEIVIVRGDVKSIKKIAKELADNKGIKNIKINFVKIV